jgi:hypothetical protein
MRGRTGALSTNWKGGVTAERQSFYSSDEWKAVVSKVWKRDNATCQNCGKHKSSYRDLPFDIHHIVTFMCRTLRAEITNLVLLCEDCHYWVHSGSNIGKKFLLPIPDDYIHEDIGSVKPEKSVFNQTKFNFA